MPNWIPTEFMGASGELSKSREESSSKVPHDLFGPMEVYGTHTLGQLSAAAARLKLPHGLVPVGSPTPGRTAGRFFAHAQVVNKVLTAE